MKLIKFLFVAAFIMVLGACSNTGNVNEKLCKSLVQKVEAGDTLSESEIAQAIDQMEAIIMLYTDKAKEYDYDRTKMEEWENSEECNRLMGYGNVLNSYLSKVELSEENNVRLTKAQERTTEKFKEMHEEAMKKMGIEVK